MKDKTKLWIVSTMFLLFIGSIITFGQITINANGSATLTFTIPSAQTQKALDCYTQNYGYQEQICDFDTGNCVNNPLTKKDFVNQVFVDFHRNNMKSCEARWYKEQYVEPTIQDMT